MADFKEGDILKSTITKDFVVQIKEIEGDKTKSEVISHGDSGWALGEIMNFSMDYLLNYYKKINLVNPAPAPAPAEETFDWFKIYKVYIKRAKINCEICNGSGVKRIYPLLEPTGMPCKCLCDYVRYYYGKEKIKIFKPQGNIIQVKFQGKKWQENFGSNSNALDVYNSIPFKEVAK
jgi:hypothetical protein